MSETIYSIGEFPGHEVLEEILDDCPMPDKPGIKGAALNDNPLDRYLRTVQHILRDCGYPTTSMELDAVLNSDTDDPNEIDELAARFTILLRLVHRTRSAWRSGEFGKFGYYMGQLSKVTAEAKYYERMPFTISGMKSYVGAQKSAKKRAAFKELKPEHQAILREGKNLLALGYSRHELATRIHRKFSLKDGFPSSVRQYRTVLKPLK